MTDAWYMTRNGQQYGPYRLEQFKQFAAEGRIAPDDMVMNMVQQRWQPACLVPGLLAPPGLKSVPKATVASQNPKSKPINISNGEAMDFARSCLLRNPGLTAPEVLTLLECRFLLGVSDDMLSDPALIPKRRRWYHDVTWVLREAKGNKDTIHAARTVLDETVAKLIAENAVSSWRGID